MWSSTLKRQCWMWDREREKRKTFHCDYCLPLCHTAITIIIIIITTVSKLTISKLTIQAPIISTFHRQQRSRQLPLKDQLRDHRLQRKSLNTNMRTCPMVDTDSCKLQSFLIRGLKAKKKVQICWMKSDRYKLIERLKYSRSFHSSSPSLLLITFFSINIKASSST